MMEFTFSMRTKVVFSAGALNKVGEEAKLLGAKKALLVTGRNFTARSPFFTQIMQSLQEAGIAVESYAEVEADPSAATIDRGAQLLRDCGADVVVAFGGGSPIDAAKFIAMLRNNQGQVMDYVRRKRLIEQPGVPLICIPSTAGSGSEVSSAAVASDREKQEKIGLSHEFLVPKTAIVDPLIHSGMPPQVTANTGIDALTHAIEAYISIRANPISDALCLQAIRMIGANLRRVVARGDDITARGEMALASLMAGVGFSSAGLGAVHGLAHPVGARFNVAHGMANGILLPYVLEYEMIGAYEKYAAIATALGEDVIGKNQREAAFLALKAVAELKRDIGIPENLREVGVTEADLEAIVEDAVTYRMLNNGARCLVRSDLAAIAANALNGAGH